MKDDKISIAKGIAIILMVVGHSGCPDILSKSIYLFHMPLFFFLSGLTFKEKYLYEKKQYVINRIKRLYWPFIKYGLIFLLLHNIFYYLNIYHSQEIGSETGLYSAQQFIDKAVKIITFRGSEQLLGGFWFLKVLFFSSIMCLFGLYVVNLVKVFRTKGLTDWIVFGVFFLALLIASKLGIDTRYFMASTVFIAGKISNRYLKKLPLNWVLLILSSAVLACCSIIKPLSMFGVNSPLLAIYYLFTSFTGIYWSLLIANLISKVNLKKHFIYIGDNTMGILVFHFISFKLVSLIKIWQFNLPITALSDFPVIDEHNSLYWILYSIIGVAVSLGLDYIFKIREGLYTKLTTKKQEN